MQLVEKRAAAVYRERLGNEPEIILSAPGRVYLIGENVGCNGSFVLSCAVDRPVAIALGRAGVGQGFLSFD